MRFDLVDLQLFIAVAETRSITNGAAKVHLALASASVLASTLRHAIATHLPVVVVTTEFGRPPEFDSGGGRGHQGSAFCCVLAGGGLKHCGAYGETDDLAKQIADKPVGVPDFFATIHAALGIDYTQNLYDGDRPVPITDMGQPIAQLFG